MDVGEFVDLITRSPSYRGQVVHAERIPAKEAVYRDLEPSCSVEIAGALERAGISKLYSHQADAVRAARNGANVVIVTSTASGKTLCYNLPVMEELHDNPRSRALYMFPTKALAQDQLRKLCNYNLSFVHAATYDGDTPKRERPFVKNNANIILTNPDMLHFGILPYHTSWAEFFRNLRYVVIDEIHTYRGVFGAHVANILRRLRRVCRYYGSDPRFIAASATVRDAGDLFAELTGLDAVVIDNDGAPSGEKLFLFWNPPVIDKTGERRSANSEAVALLTRLLESQIRTIVFTKARKTAELILRYAKTALREQHSVAAEKVMSYRAGYTPAERRMIERRLFDGELLGVTSTTALEVGIDIGGLDAVIMTGYPGSVAATWQQVGRAGRGGRRSLAVLVALDNPVDQFLMRRPGYFFSEHHERVIVDHANPYVMAEHLVCAAYELPITNEELDCLFGDRAWEVMAVLEEIGEVGFRGKWFWLGSDYPAARVNIRSTSPESFDIVAINGKGVLLGTVDGGNAFETVHPGAIYLHGGESYVVTKLDISSRVAYVEQSEVNYYTTPGTRTRVEIREQVESRSLGIAEVAFGDVTVTSRVTHFWRKRLYSDRVIEKVNLDLPESELATESIWIVISEALTDLIIGRGFDLAGTIHAIEHAAIGVMPLFALCDRQDIGGVSHHSHPDTGGRATVFIYDGHAGGIGLSRAAYENISELLAVTLETLRDCPCEDGCPSCVQSPKCGNNNEPLDKSGAFFVLEEILRPNVAECPT